MNERRTHDGLWVYGVLDGDVAGPPRCRGVDDAHDVELIRHAGLAAVTSPVSLDEFGERGLREALEDLHRLEALARAHERVLDEALRMGAVVPFRICTVYAGAERVQEMLEREREPLTAALRRLRGMAEWGVKAYLVEREATGTAAAAPASGTDYLARKRTARDAAEMARRGLEASVDAVHARLRERAAGAVLSPPQDRRLSGRDGQMLLNAAYLVADADADAFGSLFAELACRLCAEGLELALTGPWPPYHFSEAAAR
jgi:Gas vesicle synthesis protein GvpL/GvpF